MAKKKETEPKETVTMPEKKFNIVQKPGTNIITYEIKEEKNK